MSERPTLRFISTEPTLAMFLRGAVKKVPVMSGNRSMLAEWGLQWLEDVGRTVRSRDVMVGNVTGLFYGKLMNMILGG